MIHIRTTKRSAHVASILSMFINDVSYFIRKSFSARCYTMNRHSFAVFFLFFVVVLCLMKGLTFLGRNVVLLLLEVYDSSKSSSLLGSSNCSKSSSFSTSSSLMILLLPLPTTTRLMIVGSVMKIRCATSLEKTQGSFWAVINSFHTAICTNGLRFRA